MIQTYLNPAWLERNRYLDFLNNAFAGSWRKTDFDWYLGRAFQGIRPDILVRASGTAVIAGLGLVHRQVRVGCDPPVNVGVISAAGTVPSARGQGHYAELLHSALERARQRAWVALLAFVTEENGSGRGLRRLGARVIPSFYLSAAARGWRDGKAGRVNTTARRDGTLPRWVKRAEIEHSKSRFRPTARSAAQAGFHYEQEDDWRQQFIERPHGIRLHRLQHDSQAWIETVGSTDRLQRLDCPASKTRHHVTTLVAACAAAGRRFFMYSLDAQLAAALKRRGLAIHRGYFMLLPADRSGQAWRTLSEASWSVQSGDRL
jgi:GNAT superfamily N-acetyltransferase